jgi:hypothetical protein
MAQGINARKQSKLEEVSATPLDLLDRTAIQVADETVYAGKLSINQLIAVAHTAVEAMTKLSPEHRNVLTELAGEDQAGGLAELSSLLAVLNEETVSQIIATIVKRDRAWVAENVGLLETLLILEAVADHNDIAQVRAVFFRLVNRFRSSAT